MVRSAIRFDGLSGKLSKLNEATQRLQAAVSALEAAACTRPRSQADGADPAPLDMLKTNNDALEARNAVISERLDQAIGRLRSLLDD